MTPKKKKTTSRKKPTAAQRKKAGVARLLTIAEKARDKNRPLIEETKRALRENDVDRARELEDLLIEDLRRVYNIDKGAMGHSCGRDTYRRYGKYSPEMVKLLFGVWAEFQRAAGLDETLGTKAVVRNISKTRRAQRIADYAERYVRPWHGTYTTLDMDKERVTLVIGSDFHSKFCDPFARRVWMDVNEIVKPDGTRYNGDLVDFPSVSTHKKLPGHFTMSLQDECDWAVDFMEETIAATGEQTDHKFIIGNHEARIIRAIAEAPGIYSLRSNSFAELFQLDRLGVGLVCQSTFLSPTAKTKKRDIAKNWEELYDADGRLFWVTVHGWLTAQNAPAAHMQRFMCYGTNGHLHDQKMVSGGSRATGVHKWYQTGCMAYPPAVAAEYMPGPIEYSGWGMSFNVVHLYPKERYVQVETVNIDDMARFGNREWHITQAELDFREELMHI